MTRRIDSHADRRFMATGLPPVVTDWVPSMKIAMGKSGRPGDVYAVGHVASRSGSIYVKTEVGWRSCLLANAEVCEITKAPYRV